MKNNMYAMVLFILVITTATISSVLCSSAPNDINDEKEILMVVEEDTSSIQPGMAQNPGRFSLRSGRSVTLSWLVKGRENCVPPGDPCGAADWCCEGAKCNGPWRLIKGTCEPIPNCGKKGEWCNVVYECCYPNRCSYPKDGVCN